MPIRQLPDFETRGRYSKDDFNLLKNEIARLGRLSAQFPLEILNNASGPSLRWIDQEFWAVLTSCVSSSSSAVPKCGDQKCPYGPKYCWLEVQPDGTGGWQVKPGGRQATVTDSINGTTTQPAYEINGACVQPGNVVRLYPGLVGEYLFDHCCTVPLPTISCSSSSSSSSSSSKSSSSSSGSSGSSQPSSASQGSQTPTMCVPYVAMVSCGGSASSAGGGGSSAGGSSGGTLVVTMKYLMIPTSLGITVSDTPCSG